MIHEEDMKRVQDETDDETRVDETRWKCHNCGWTGTTHELKPITLSCPECHKFESVKLFKV